MVMIIMDSNQPYTDFITETLEVLAKENIRWLALVAITDSQAELTAYWNMSLRDKLQAETALRFDSFDTFLLANSDRYGIWGDE